MANVAGAVLYSPELIFKGSKVASVVFSGTVKVDGVFAARKVIGINTLTPDRRVETISSAVDGSWELTIRMHPPEEARIIVVGAAGENSEIYEHLVE